MTKSRATDRRWQEEEYRRLMGDDALARQKTQRVARERAKEPVCTCGWKLERGKTPGPHHDPRCDLYQQEKV